MIHVDRPPGSAPAALEKRDRANRTERERAVEFHAGLEAAGGGDDDQLARRTGASAGTKKKDRFDFKAYGHRDVREALDALFHYKCAYCETYYGASQPVDVEHYRPKGAIVDDGGKRQKPGYYWLASDWDNLLPSCIDCNRKRGHGASDGAERLQHGKANQFPIAGTRALEPVQDIDKLERPLLLHPCRDDPSLNLSFDDEGLIRGLTEEGRASIKVLGLTRWGLVKARKELAIALLGHLVEARRVIETYNKERSRDNEDWVREKLRTIKGFGEPTRPYSAMCLEILERRMPPLLEKLEVDVFSIAAAA